MTIAPKLRHQLDALACQLPPGLAGFVLFILFAGLAYASGFFGADVLEK